MTQTKKELKFFSITQYRKEEEYLCNMHKNGWKLTGVTFPGLYSFEKCRPENVIYRLDYNKEGTANKSQYIQLFSDCGWEYMFDFVGYSYFRKATEVTDTDEEIFCDEESRFDMMKRVLRGRMVPLIIFFFCVILPQLFVNTIGYGTPSVVQDILSITFLLMGVIYALMFGIFTIRFYNYEKNIHPVKSIKIKYAGIFCGIALCVLAMGGVVGCSFLSNFELIENERGFIIEADSLYKSIVKEFYLNEGDTIYVSHDSKGGDLSMTIGKEDEEPVFTGNTFEEFEDFGVEIQESGIYQIKCKGRKVRGKIEIIIQ